MKELRGKAAVVTGGGSGIGRGIALALGREEMSVMVADIEAASAEAVSKEIVESGGRALATRVDVTSEASLDELCQRSLSALGAVHLLSNNAGVLVPMEAMRTKTTADWEYVFSVNVFGIVKSVQAFLPGMLEQGEGHVVNTASMAGLVALPTLPIGIYTASKYACVGYTEMLRGELAGTGVSASVLCPGMVKSNLTATSARNRPDTFGGPDAVPGATPPDMEARMMDAAVVGEIVVRGVREDRLHLITHPESRALVEQRFRGLLDDFDAGGPR